MVYIHIHIHVLIHIHIHIHLCIYPSGGYRKLEQESFTAQEEARIAAAKSRATATAARYVPNVPICRYNTKVEMVLLVQGGTSSV